jgi:hypothetical protein
LAEGFPSQLWTKSTTILARRKACNWRDLEGELDLCRRKISEVSPIIDVVSSKSTELLLVWRPLESAIDAINNMEASMCPLQATQRGRWRRFRSGKTRRQGSSIEPSSSQPQHSSGLYAGRRCPIWLCPSAAVMASLSDIAEQSLLQQRRPVLLSPSRFTTGWASNSRLREMLVGGVTRHILKNASARPVLLAH